MGISLVLAVTDNDWFDQLRHRPDLEEVNFWSPSPRQFRSLRGGELLLFKLRAPRNAIAGCGIFAHTNALPCSLAWEAFGTANGTRSLPKNAKADREDLSSADKKVLSRLVAAIKKEEKI